MNQAVTKSPYMLYTNEEHIISRAIPEVWNDINDISKRTIYECAQHQIYKFREQRAPSFRPSSYIEPILDDLCCRTPMRYRYEGNACQVLFAMCIMMRSPCAMHCYMEQFFADNISDYLMKIGYFRDAQALIEEAVEDLTALKESAPTYEKPNLTIQPQVKNKDFQPKEAAAQVTVQYIFNIEKVENFYAHVEQLENKQL